LRHNLKGEEKAKILFPFRYFLLFCVPAQAEQAEQNRSACPVQVRNIFIGVDVSK